MQRSETIRANGAFVAAIAFAALVPGVFAEAQIFTMATAVATVIALLSLNSLLGYAGQVSLGQAAFVGTGGFVAIHIGGRGLPLPLTVLVTGLVVAALTAIVGLPSLRIRGLAVAVATLVYGIFAQNYLFNAPWFLPTDVQIAAPLGRGPAYGMYLVTLAFLVAVVLLDRQLLSTKLGRSFITVREAEERAVAFSVDPGPVKLKAYALSGFFAGIAGALIAYQIGGVAGSDYGVLQSLEFLAIAVVGGAGSRAGVIAAGALLIGLPGLVPPPDARLAPLFSAILLVLVIIFLPSGFGGVIARIKPTMRRVLTSAGAVIGVAAVWFANTGRANEAEVFGETWGSGPLVLALIGCAALAVVPWVLKPPEVEDVEVEGALDVSGDAAERAKKAAHNAVIVRVVPRGLSLRMPSRVMFEAKNVGVRFGGVQALLDIDLEVREGEIVGLIGANGAGKSTFYNVVSGFVTPTAGSSLKYKGVELLDIPPSARPIVGIGRTFQHMGLVRPQTVEDNVLLAQTWLANYDDWAGILRAFGTVRTERELRHRAELALEIFGLERYRNKELGSLPYGTMRMCELASAVASGADLLFFDEASAGLAPDEAHGLADRFHALRDELGLTLVVIEHHVPLIARVCDYVYCLASGRQLAEGEPASIQDNPEVIAEFLGRSAIGEGGKAAIPGREKVGAGAGGEG